MEKNTSQTHSEEEEALDPTQELGNSTGVIHPSIEWKREGVPPPEKNKERQPHKGGERSSEITEKPSPNWRNCHKTCRQRVSHSSHEPWWLCCWSQETADNRRALPPIGQRSTTIYAEEITKLQAEMKARNAINQETKDYLTPLHVRTATFYLLPKIHKPGNSGCPIVSSCGAPTEKISQSLWTTTRAHLWKTYPPSSRTLPAS